MLDRPPRGGGRPPLAIAAKNAQLVASYPGAISLWRADLKACRHGVQCDVFENILFVEANGVANIYGIEFEDGYPNDGLAPDLALKQQAFIRFLQEETRQDNEALGFLAQIFHGHEYSAEGMATAAYIVARDAALQMGIGYRDADGKYDLISLDPADDSWFDNARAILPFDALGQTEQVNGL